ncbi:MAG: hypothetical protein ACRYG8_43135 [Janthinobacterium lividum]
MVSNVLRHGARGAGVHLEPPLSDRPTPYPLRSPHAIPASTAAVRMPPLPRPVRQRHPQRVDRNLGAGRAQILRHVR